MAFDKSVCAPPRLAVLDRRVIDCGKRFTANELSAVLAR
jgi:hypothetical protein